VRRRRFDHFRILARLCERGVLIAHKQAVTQQDGEMTYPCGLRPKCGHSVLLGIRLESPNLNPRALIGRIWGSSANIAQV